MGCILFFVNPILGKLSFLKIICREDRSYADHILSPTKGSRVRRKRTTQMFKSRALSVIKFSTGYWGSRFLKQEGKWRDHVFLSLEQCRPRALCGMEVPVPTSTPGSVPLGGGKYPVLGDRGGQTKVSIKPRSARRPALRTVLQARQLEMETNFHSNK